MWLIDFILSLFRKPTGILPTVTGGDDVFTPSIVMDGNWFPYMSLPYETQYTNFDQKNCVTKSGMHSVEAILNYFYKNRLFPNQGMYDLIEKGGFLNAQGYIDLSERFTAKMAGTTQAGLAMDKFWESINRDGIVPKSAYSDPTITTWEEYYRPVPQAVIEAGKRAAQIFQWNWKVIKNNEWNAPVIADLKNALYHSPLHFASELGTHDFDGIDRPTGKQVYAHARTIFRVDDFIETLDQYPYPDFLHKLSLDFPMACVIVCSLKII